MSIRASFSVPRLKKKVKHWLYHRCPVRAGWMSYFGTKIYFPRNCHLVNRVIQCGIYEPELLGDIQTVLRGEGVHFDIGANIGLMAVPLLSEDPNIIIHSFEPSPVTFTYLTRTHRESSHKHRWHISDVALAADDGTTSFCMHPESEGAFDGISDTGRVPDGQLVQVKMLMLDTYWEHAGKPAVRTIKIDVEGFEDEVLRGAGKVLRQCRPVVFLEWSKENLRPGIKAASIMSLATQLEYQVYSLPGRQRILDLTDLLTSMKFTESFMMAPIVSE